MSTDTLQLVLTELRHQERRSREPWEFRSALEDAIEFVERAISSAPGANLVRAEHVSGVRVEPGPSSPVLSPGPQPRRDERPWRVMNDWDTIVGTFRTRGEAEYWRDRSRVAHHPNAYVEPTWAPPRAARASLIPSVERALFGTTDGHLLAAEATVPVGELRRLLRDVWAQDDVPVPAAAGGTRRLAWSLFHEGGRVGSIVTDLDTEEWSAGSAGTEDLARAIALQRLAESPSGGKGAQDADLVESCRAAVLRPGDVPSHLAAAALEELTRARDQVAAGDELAAEVSTVLESSGVSSSAFAPVGQALRAWQAAGGSAASADDPIAPADGWPGPGSEPGTYDRIVAEVQRSWPLWSELHGLSGVDRAIEHAVHVTISMLQQQGALPGSGEQG